jgi:peroxiredoxin
MRKLLASLLFAATLFAASVGKSTVPRKADEFVIQNPDGKQQLLSTYKGKTIVMAFMFTTCPHCQKTAQLLTQIQKEYADKGVQILGATFDTGAAFRVQQFDKIFNLNFPCGYSNQESVLQFLHVPVNEPVFVPILVFIDKTGTVRSQYIGDEKFLANQEVNIRAEIDKMLKPAAASAGSLGKKLPRS